MGAFSVQKLMDKAIIDFEKIFGYLWGSNFYR